MQSLSRWWSSDNENSTKILTSENLQDLETGDLLLFHGEGFWFSWVVEWATWSEFSHVAIVLKDPTFLDCSLKGLYMLESGIERFPDAIEHRLHFGVQVVNLEKVIEYYTGKAYYRKLDVIETVREKFSPAIEQIWNNIKDRPYDDNVWDLIRGELGLDWGDMNRTNKFYCSALVTFCYEKFNLLTEDVPWDLIKPEDYNVGGKIERLFKKDVNLGEKVRLK